MQETAITMDTENPFYPTVDLLYIIVSIQMHDMLKTMRMWWEINECIYSNGQILWNY